MKDKLSFNFVVFLLGICFAVSCKNKTGSVLQEKTNSDSLFVSLYTRLSEPEPGDWIAEHPEPSQSIDAYINSSPAVPDSLRKFIYLVPLDQFDSVELSLINITAEYLRAVLDLPVKIKTGISIDDIPSDKKRNGQLNSGYILHDLLIKNLPDDAVGMMAITSSDLYPDDDWNFVFGEANTRERVGVSSFYRYGDASESDSAFNFCLRRLMGTTSHEFLHMLSMQHCKTYACVLNGSNSLQESDKKPLLICPLCLEKLNFALNENPSDYFRRLSFFYNKYGFSKELEFCENGFHIFQKIYNE